ncbi:hypothetical protein DFH06DRAFT_1139691 [Mycena polygramma]|nr:hypothetical protein DFH06DRAFT_1139691 [Mycena polygramma]
MSDELATHLVNLPPSEFLATTFMNARSLSRPIGPRGEDQVSISVGPRVRQGSLFTLVLPTQFCLFPCSSTFNSHFWLPPPRRRTTLGADCCGMPGKRRAPSEAQRQAEARYREKNGEELRRKARERMAARRAKIAATEEYRAQAWDNSARFRAENGPELRRKARQRRAKVSIAKIGYDAWLEGYEQRHPPVPEVEADPEPVAEPDAEPEPEHIQRVRDRFLDHQTRVNDWLDNCDPTTAPDYVPKPGEHPYFQRGKRRWY